MTTGDDSATIASSEAARTVGEVGERRVIELLTRAALAASDESTAEVPSDVSPSDVGPVDAGPSAGSADASGDSRRRFADDIVVGSGDDAAVFDVGGPTVISVDTAVEGRHFRFDWSEARDIGARAVVQSAADIAAMGGRTVGVVVSVGCPSTTVVGLLLGLNDGIVAAAHRLGARVLGGDLVESDEVVLSVTAVGAMDGRTPVALTGAVVGDVLAVSGPLGAGAAGLAVLTERATKGRSTWSIPEGPDADVVAAYRLPHPDLTQGIDAARAGAHAMTDISDGLIEELVTMAKASGVRLSVDGARVPRTDAVTEVARRLNVDADAWALTGGEDHELLAAFAPGTVPAGWTEIGSVLAGNAEGAGTVEVDGHGVDGLSGWQSFGPADGTRG